MGRRNQSEGDLMFVFAFDRKVSYSGVTEQPVCGPKSDKPWAPMCVSHWQIECYLDSTKLMPTKMLTKLYMPFIYPISFRYYAGGVWASMQEFDKEIAAFDWISEDVLTALRAKRALFVLDDKTEGHPVVNDYLFKYLHMLAARLQIPEQTLVFVTSNLLAERKYEAWAKRIPEDKQVRVISDNWFAPDTYRNIWRKNRQFDETLIDRTFLCFNRHFNNFREHLVRDLLNEGLVNKGYVSLCAANEDEESKLADPDTYYGWAADASLREWYAKTSKDFLRQLPFTVDTVNFSHNHVRTITPEFYNKTLLSLVTETWVHEDTIFITEKTYKAMQMLHPFIILGNHGTLRELRARGFKTFAPYINEEYDDEPNLEKRKNLILKELHRLSQMPIQEQQRLAVEMQDAARHNKHLLQSLKHSYGKPILEHFEYVTGKNFYRRREAKSLQ